MFSHRPTQGHPFAWGRIRSLVAICLGSCGILACGSDPAGPSDPGIPGGGQEYVLDAALFASAIAPILTARGCDAGGDCHGGGIRGSYELSPQAAKNTAFDFEQSALQVNGYDPLNSPLLTEPLAEAGGGTAHPFTAFADTDDADWQTLRDWILAGEFQ